MRALHSPFLASKPSCSHTLLRRQKEKVEWEKNQVGAGEWQRGDGNGGPSPQPPAAETFPQQQFYSSAGPADDDGGDKRFCLPVLDQICDWNILMGPVFGLAFAALPALLRSGKRKPRRKAAGGGGGGGSGAGVDKSSEEYKDLRAALIGIISTADRGSLSVKQVGRQRPRSLWRSACAFCLLAAATRCP